MKFNRTLIFIILTSTIIKTIIIFTISDYKSLNYWEYGIIAKNILDGKGYSFFYYDSDSVKFEYSPASSPHPSAYMPPAYIYYLLPFMAIKDNNTRNIIFLLFQIIISNLAIYLIFKLSTKFFNEKIGIISALIYAFLPEFIYSNLTVGTTLLYHIFVSVLLLIIDNLNSNRNLLIASLILIILVYLRAEFTIFIVLLLIYLLIRKQFYQFTILFIVIIISLFPWQFRNYIVFKRIIPMTTSSGLNFYRGHNPYEPGTWADERIADSLNKLAIYKDYEIKMSDLYYSEAFRSIKQNPLNEIKNSFLKLFHLWIFNPNDERSFHPLYLVPWFIGLLLFIYGAVKLSKQYQFNFIYIFIIYHCIMAIIFFSLPRYQTMMKIALLPFIAWSINDLYIRFKKMIG